MLVSGGTKSPATLVQERREKGKWRECTETSLEHFAVKAKTEMQQWVEGRAVEGRKSQADASSLPAARSRMASGLVLSVPCSIGAGFRTQITQCHLLGSVIGFQVHTGPRTFTAGS